MKYDWGGGGAVSVRCEICHIKLQMGKPNQGSTSTNIVLNSFLINRRKQSYFSCTFNMLSRELGKLGHVDSATPVTFSKIIKNRIQSYSLLSSPSLSFLFLHFVLKFFIYSMTIMQD